MPILRVCKTCNSPFSVKPSLLSRGERVGRVYGTYCSRTCQGMGMRGVPSPRDKRVTNPCLICGVPVRRKLSSLKDKVFCNPQHYREHWSKFGKENATYKAYHLWVKAHRGNPSLCEHCGATKGRFEWANKSHLYKRELSDWIRLCISCHRKYDKKHRGASLRRFPNLVVQLKKNPK